MIPWHLRGVGWPGSRTAALAPSSPAPHHEAQLPRANTAWTSPQLGHEGETRESQNRRDESDARATVRPMSVVQIIDELPKLTPADLLAVRRKLIEISEENEGASLCDAAALQGAQLLDQMEAGDSAR